MEERAPKRLSRKDAIPLNLTPKPNDVLAKQNEYIDDILIRQGATLTDANRQDLREKIEHISMHRS